MGDNIAQAIFSIGFVFLWRADIASGVYYSCKYFDRKGFASLGLRCSSCHRPDYIHEVARGLPTDLHWDRCEATLNPI